MKYIVKKVIGFFILLNIGPCLVWLLWDYSYKPYNRIDAFFNSFHPFFAGWIGNFSILGTIGVIMLAVTLIESDNKKNKPHERHQPPH